MSTKPRVVSLYTELTSLKMNDKEKVIEYMLRAKQAVTSLKGTGEVIGDSLLIAMILKELHKAFSRYCLHPER